MRKRQTVQPCLEPVESRVVLSATGIYAAHLAHSVTAHVSRVRAHVEQMREVRAAAGHVTKLGHPVVRHVPTRAALTVTDHAKKPRSPVEHFAPIPPPRKPPTAASQKPASGLAGLFKSIASGL